MNRIGHEVIIIGGTAFAVWLLYWLSPEVGRKVSLAGSIVFLVWLGASLVRRLQRTERVPLPPGEDQSERNLRKP